MEIQIKREIEKELISLVGEEKFKKLISFQNQKTNVLITYFHKKYRVLVKVGSQLNGKTRTRYFSVYNSQIKKEAEKVRNLIRLLFCY